MEDLVTRAKNGDKDAYTELFLDVKDDLFKVAFKMLGNKSDAEDIIQDTLLIAYVNISKLRTNKYFKSWITRILINECKKFIKFKKSNNIMIERYAATYEHDNDFNIDEIDFEKVMKLLSAKDQEIFSLFYIDRLTTKQISERLNINENTIKSRLKICRNRLKTKYGYMFTIIAVLVMVTGVVFGSVALIKYIIEQFDLHDVGYSNDNILAAIEDKEWVQNVDMDYIELDDNYSIRVDYLLYDDMNLYMIFDLQSKSGFGEYNRFSIPSLKVEDENGNVIINTYDWVLKQQLSLISAWKNIESNNNNIRELVRIVSNGFPNMNKLIISLGSLAIYTQSDNISRNENEFSTKETSFEINLDEKFINKSSHEYTVINQSDDLGFEIEKAIFSDTGFYTIIKTSDESVMKFTISDINGKAYSTSIVLLSTMRENNNNKYYYYLITSDIPLENSNTIILKNSRDTSHIVKFNY